MRGRKDAAIDMRIAADQCIDRMTEEESLAGYLALVVRCPSQPYENQLLIWKQYPKASEVAGALRWKREGKAIREGEKPIWILLPYIRYLKTDAAEALVLTGTDDREKAAFMLCEWGAGEVIITHNTEALVCDGEHIYRSPLLPRGLAGRTGRGDTTFAGYLCERLTRDIPEALEFAAALVSLKMETPGPFKGTREDVEDFIRRYYR